jgi:hypothetical protein
MRKRAPLWPIAFALAACEGGGTIPTSSSMAAWTRPVAVDMAMPVLCAQGLCKTNQMACVCNAGDPLGVCSSTQQGCANENFTGVPDKTPCTINGISSPSAPYDWFYKNPDQTLVKQGVVEFPQYFTADWFYRVQNNQCIANPNMIRMCAGPAHFLSVICGNPTQAVAQCDCNTIPPGAYCVQLHISNTCP